ncbi:MFS transporter [Alicyclobacillus sp. SO9]|uniref:MFS transporter n=1 Tax=Alicyclobacillus sp. SO9 TaxID=2665646 RepID=UPI0018E6F7B8|nr:MFS transporter [Alicyclobacillus sp. SO9]QQE78134.1 MFS transporter [Alicyclobacillus sp. SO9]
MQWKRTLVILVFANFIVVSGMSLIIPFLPLYIEQLGVHNMATVERWSGWVFSAQFVTSFLFQPLWGVIADRHGRKIMLLRAGIGMGVMTILMGLVGAPWELLVLRLINGIFSGFISMAVSLQASVTPDEHSGRALGILQTGTVAGNLIGPLAGGALAEAIGYSHVFYLTGALLILASLIVAVFVKEERVRVAKVKDQRKVAWKSLVPLWPVFLASVVTQLGMMSIEPIVTLYAKTLYTGPHLALVAGFVVAITGIANMIGSPLLGRLGDNIGQRKILMLALVMAAMAYIPQALAGGITVLLVGRFFLGLFVGGMIPSLNVLVKKLAPKEIQATAFGFNSSSLFLGNLLGPILGSSVAAAFNIRAVFYVTMSILLINAVTIAFNKSLDRRQNTSATAPVS